VAPVHHHAADRALQARDALLLVAGRRVGKLGQDQLAARILAFVVGEGAAADIEQLALHALGQGDQGMPERVGLDADLDRLCDAAIGVVGKADDRRQFVHGGIGKPCRLHRVARILRHPLAVGRASGAVRDLGDDLLHMRANVGGRHLGQDGVLGHFSLSVMHRARAGRLPAAPSIPRA